MGKYIAEDDVSRRLMPFASRGGSTAFAMLALELAGLQPDEVPMVAGRRWLVSNQCQRTDSIPVTEAPTGWAFEGNNDVYPDSDDTAIVLASLLQPGWRNDPPLARAVETGFAWLASQQHPSGGWAAFDRYPDWLCQAPGGRILDKVGLLELPSGGITARCLMAWAHLRGEDLDPVRRATTWLVRHQSPDGTWEDRWTPGYATSTGCVVLALAMTGLPEGAKAAARGAEWLRGAQNDDGGWGSRLPVTTFPRWPGVRRAGVLDEPLSKDVARSTVFETSMSLLALLSHTCSTEPAIERGIRYLLSMQDDQGSWSDDAPVIVYLADQWYNSYPLVSTATAMCAILTYERVSTGIQRSSRSFLPIGMLA